jgi:hypothetical protein
MSQPIAIALTGSNQTVWTGAGLYFGFAMRETAGASSATAKVYDGTSASGVLLETVNLTAGESSSDYYGPKGIRFSTGLYVQLGGSGTIEGSLRAG